METHTGENQLTFKELEEGFPGSHQLSNYIQTHRNVTSVAGDSWTVAYNRVYVNTHENSVRPRFEGPTMSHYTAFSVRRALPDKTSDWRD